jgi:SAM-dependent methyltransferase
MWEVADRLGGEHAASAVAEVVKRAEVQRQLCTASAWRDFVEGEVANHPLCGRLCEDPYTRRARVKPRGYAGDAVTLDYVYFGQEDEFQHSPETTELGRVVFDHTIGSGSASAVRSRRNRLAALVDDASAKARSEVSVLAIASGHLREADLSSALRDRRVITWACLDQDGESLAIASQHPSPAIIPIHRSIKDLIRGEVELGLFDVVYAAGLFDYLDDAVASRLLRLMCDRLAPGGRVLVANFAEGNPERGYMEAFMDWWLVYRNEADMRRLADALPEGLAARVELDEEQRIWYLEAARD